VDDLKLGSIVRAIRRKKRLRQLDLASAAGVSQQSVSDLERGRLDSLALVRRICTALGVSVSLTPAWRGGDFDRLTDARHAGLVERLGRTLASSGWIVLPEFSFNHYGDRGSVDVLAWRSDFEALLIVEVKTDIRNVNELLRRLDVKRRVVPGVMAREHGRQARSVATVLVLPSTSAGRRAIRSHEATFDAALPARTVEVRRWLQNPDRDIAGILFVPDTARGGARSRITVAKKRIRAGSDEKVPTPRTK
jgi:transcriptional regulator with XRE-family HTH domain